MKPILFEKDATVFTTFGLGTLSDAISCYVTEERNGSYELEMVYPLTGVKFDELQEDRIIVAKPRENGTRQAFRIYRIVRELEGTVTVNARHISYQLNFVPINPVSGNKTAQNMMGSLKTAALETCPFTFTSNISGAKQFNIPYPVSLRKALGGMEGSVLDLFGGEFEWDNWDVKLLQARGSDKGAKIEYGKNMTALERSTDIGELITGVMAYWQGEDSGGNIVTVYSSPKVISNGNEADYAHAHTVVLDISGEFENQPTQVEVTSYATAFLASTELAHVAEAVSVDFVPLWQTEEFANTLQAHVDLCDTVTVVYKPLGVNVKKKVTKTVFDVLLNRYESIELGGEETVADTIADLANESSDLSRELARMAIDIGNIALNNLTGVTTNLLGYTSSSNMYTFPGDGYVFLSNNSGQTGAGYLVGSGQTTGYLQIGNYQGRYTTFVRKGMKTYISGTSAIYRYVRLT